MAYTNAFTMFGFGISHAVIVVTVARRFITDLQMVQKYVTKMIYQSIIRFVSMSGPWVWSPFPLRPGWSVLAFFLLSGQKRRWVIERYGEKSWL